MANSTEEQFLELTGMNGKVVRPRIEISFHTSSGLYHARSGSINKFGERLNPNNQVLSVTTQKQLSSPAGFFNINLVGSQWGTYLNAQDLVVIKMGYAGEARMTTVMVGLIDKINRRRVMGSDGKPQVNMAVTGRDFGKLFVKDLLKFYPEITGKNAADFFLTDVGWINLMKIFTTDNIMKGTPAVIIDNIMKYIFPKVHDVSWTLWNEKATTASSKSVNVKNIITHNLAKMNFFMPFIFTADQYEGALWNLIERAAPKPFAELFIDTRDHDEIFMGSSNSQLIPSTIEKWADPNVFAFGEDGAKVVLALRDTPYESVHKNKLITHEIPVEDIINDDLSMDDERHYNLFWAGTTINPLGIDLKRVAPPLLNEADAKKFGLSPLEVNIEGMEITDSLVLEGMSKTFTGRLKVWFERNHYLWNGQLEIKGKANIRVGQMVKFGNKSYAYREYYVEGVSQQFSVFQGWTTTITVTRGMRPGTVVDSSKYVWSPPQPPPPPAAPPTPPASYYTVVKGDTLWAISKRKYGDPLKWRKIWEANKSMLIARDKRNATDHGHWIYPGQKLTIPA